MTDIKVPVSAPGATEAAAQVGAVAVQVEKLSKFQQRQAETADQVTATAKKAAEQEEKFRAAVQRSAEAMSRRHDILNKNSRLLAQARVDYRNGGDGGGGGGMSNEMRGGLIRMVAGEKGARMLNMMGGAGGMSGGLVAGLGAAGVALGAFALAARISSVATERANEATLERIKIDQDMARKAREFAKQRQDESFKTFGGIRDASRFILGTQGAQGASDIKQALGMGGPEAVKALAEFYKTRGKSVKGVTASQVLGDVGNIQDITGASTVDILRELTSQKGRYSPDRALKGMTGGQSVEMFKYYSETGMGTGLGKTIDQYDEIERARMKEQMKRTTSGADVLAGAQSALEAYLDPMAKVITENNLKIAEEVAQRQALITANKSMIDSILDGSERISKMLQTIGIESVSTKAEREANALRKGLR